MVSKGQFSGSRLESHCAVRKLTAMFNNTKPRIKLEEPKREKGHGKCSVVIALMRKNSNVNFQRTDPSTNTPPIGFFIYKVSVLHTFYASTFCYACV